MIAMFNGQPVFGPRGATFTPSVSESGELSWTNNGGLPNPEPVNIKGPQGNPGADANAAEILTEAKAYTDAEIEAQKAEIDELRTDLTETDSRLSESITDLDDELSVLHTYTGDDPNVVTHIVRMNGLLYDGKQILKANDNYNGIYFKVRPNQTAIFNTSSNKTQSIVLDEKPYDGMNVPSKVEVVKSYKNSSEAIKYIFTTFKITENDNSYIDLSYMSSGLAETVNKISYEVQNLNPVEYNDSDTKCVENIIDFINTEKIVNNVGELTDNAIYSTTDYIPVNGNNFVGIYRTGTETKFALWQYALYDSSKKFIKLVGATTDYEIVDYNGKKVTWLPIENHNAKYVRISRETARTQFSYYVVSMAVSSYDVPYLTFDGKDILSDVINSDKALKTVDLITEKAPANNNILNPSLLKKNGYYFDFNDGITHVAYPSAYCTDEYIMIPKNVWQFYITNNIDNSTNIFAIYFYSDDAYLGKKHAKFSDCFNKIYTIALPNNATKIRLYSNGVSGENLCISVNDIDSFEEYSEKTVIKKNALPETGKDYLPLYGKKIVNFGDSIFGNKRSPYDVSTSLANITGATVYNCGFGGCRMSSNNANWDAFSMYRLADAIANNDYTLQNAVDIPNVSGMPSYFVETRALLKSIDFNDVDIITIAYGTNDFSGDKPIDNTDNPKDTTSFCGALRYSIETLLGAYPHLKIYVCGQTYRFWVDTNNNNAFIDDSDTRKNSKGAKLTDFVEKTKEVAKEYHLKFIDNYYDLGINKYNRSHWFPPTDGTHHNPLGGKLIAEHMANEMF